MNILSSLSSRFISGASDDINGSNHGTNNGDVLNSPPSVLFFFIINCDLADLEHGESNDDIMKQIVVYLSFENHPVSENEMVKRVGLVQGLDDFSLKFLSSSGKGHLTHIDTDKTRIVVGQLQNSYRFVCGLRLACTNKRFISGKGLASPDYIINEIQMGYNLWMMNYGSLTSETPHDILEKWWRSWFDNRFEFPAGYNLNDKGFLNLIQGRRLCSVEFPIGFAKNLQLHMTAFIDQETDLQDIVVINSNWTPCKNYGFSA
ncbi:hypothetical protein FOA43_000890 [Brettanomyces nanus]|uniref:Uncharacterized protein n=1 Tax=Eeniella nana TaxID=13502 RepID=A0A875RY29_EENNA|nr:uncharacterized protein FOA43_000890 [Brettanomyces nanus]QPG73578.1 hypothetical protein FOA43_000890 [Brettanomyces nanus]